MQQKTHTRPSPTRKGLGLGNVQFGEEKVEGGYDCSNYLKSCHLEGRALFLSAAEDVNEFKLQVER